MIPVTVALPVVDKDQRFVTHVVENSSSWFTSTSLWNGKVSLSFGQKVVNKPVFFMNWGY